MEPYELAAFLLMKAEEPCWDTHGHLWLNSCGQPMLTAKVTVGLHAAGEMREGTFKYDGLAWKKSE